VRAMQMQYVVDVVCRKCEIRCVVYFRIQTTRYGDIRPKNAVRSGPFL